MLLEPGDSAGESFYNQWLPEVVEELLAAGVATHSDGAVVVESEEVKAPDGQPAVLMVQKRDGGYGYDTTDLATLRYRVRDLKADRILYVVDARQALHFRLIFEAARRMGWLTEGVEAVHVAFGTVLGPDGRPFKTRAGGTVRLMHLIDEAVDSARRTVAEREPDLPPAELDRIAEQAGVGAVKYADLSTSRVKDYTFDIARMVSLTGNTSVYLQYAHARICSILRKARRARRPSPDPRLPMHPAERALVLALDEFGDVLRDVAAASEPHRLCTYLFETAKAFTDFYENCPVLAAEEGVRANRLALCRLAAATLRDGLGLLGIAAPERRMSTEVPYHPPAGLIHVRQQQLDDGGEQRPRQVQRRERGDGAGRVVGRHGPVHPFLGRQLDLRGVEQGEQPLRDVPVAGRQRCRRPAGARRPRPRRPTEGGRHAAGHRARDGRRASVPSTSTAVTPANPQSTTS